MPRRGPVGPAGGGTGATGATGATGPTGATGSAGSGGTRFTTIAAGVDASVTPVVVTCPGVAIGDTVAFAVWIGPSGPVDVTTSYDSPVTAPNVVTQNGLDLSGGSGASFVTIEKA